MVLLQVLSPDKIALALHTKQDMHIRARLNTRLNMGSVVTHRAVQSWSRHRHDCRDFGVTMASTSEAEPNLSVTRCSHVWYEVRVWKYRVWRVLDDVVGA
jgi:hypothetical protein